MTTPRIKFRSSPRYHADGIAVFFGSSQDSRLIYDGTNDEWTVQTKDAGGTQTDRVKVVANADITTVELYNDDPGATGIRQDVHHDSASPAASDILHHLRVYGEDDGGAKTQYGGLKFTLLDPVNASEDGKATIEVMTAGTLRAIDTPVVTADDVFAVLGLAQTFSSVKTFSAEPVFNDNIAVALGAGSDARLYYDGTNLIIEPRVVGSGNVIINDAAILFVNETAHAQVAVGLVLNQGANGDVIFALKSSDVATGFTTGPTGPDVETDDYFVMAKARSAAGGVILQALHEDASGDQVFNLFSFGGTATTTKTTAGRGLMDIFIAESDGSNARADIAADGNILSIRARVGGSDLTRFLIDEDGDFYSVTTGQTFDDIDDGAVLEAYDQVRSGSLKKAVKAEFGRMVEIDEVALIELGILGGPMKDDPLTNWTQLCRLLTGGYRQQRNRISALENKLLALEAR